MGLNGSGVIFSVVAQVLDFIAMERATGFNPLPKLARKHNR